MALPLPKAVADMPEEGWVMSGLKHQNALTKANIENQYLPITKKSEAASKLAYANLMGPQFLAKLMGNDSALGNMSDKQAKAAIQMLYQAGTGQGTGNALVGGGASNPNIMPSPRGDGALNALLDYFMGKNKPVNPMAQPQQGGQPQNAFVQAPQATQQEDSSSMPGMDTSNLPPNVQQDIGNMQPGESYTIPAPQPVNREPSFAENTGNFKGIVKEGEEAGQIRAKDLQELNQQVFNAETALTTLGELGKVISSPEFEEIRQVPLAGRHELAYYAKEGTPAQQQMVGKYYALTGNLVKDASRDFAGSFRKGEQTLLEGMKPSPGDTVDTAKGKTESITYLLKMLQARSKMTTDIMHKYHVDKGQAGDIADRTINGQAIREKIHDSLNPTITVRNKKTGEVKTISGAEARKLGAANV